MLIHTRFAARYPALGHMLSTKMRTTPTNRIASTRPWWQRSTCRHMRGRGARPATSRRHTDKCRRDKGKTRPKAQTESQCEKREVPDTETSARADGTRGKTRLKLEDRIGERGDDQSPKCRQNFSLRPCARRRLLPRGVNGTIQGM